MSAPFFSVMMPTRGRAAMLRSAFKSLQWQTFGDFEVIAMDDGSTDDTPKVFEEFAADERFRFHRFPPTGVAKCRNFALGVARGRWIDFLDDDDLWLPTRLQKFKEAADAKPSYGFWYSNAYVWRFDRIVGRFFDPARPIPEGKVPGWYAIGEDRLPYVTTNMSIRADAVAAVGKFHEDSPILADTDMVVRVLAAGYETGVIREPLAVRRLHDAQVTRDHAKAFQESAVPLASAKLPPAEEAALRRRYAHDAARYLIKGLEPEKARAFLASAPIPRDAAYWGLYAAALTPRPVLAGLRAARAAFLRKGPVALPARSLEFAAVEELVRPLM
ncbi:MAG: glycosyltransferase family 2 protein [Elusimicrobiota bacterium]|nr:glycosyltransferase family 2 protein [Elusimicrobiota bacterium]